MTRRFSLLPDAQTVRARGVAIGFAALAAIVASSLVAEAGLQDGFQVWDALRFVLVLLTTGWLAWGAALGLTGLRPAPAGRSPGSGGVARVNRGSRADLQRRSDRHLCPDRRDGRLASAGRAGP